MAPSAPPPATVPAPHPAAAAAAAPPPVAAAVTKPELVTVKREKTASTDGMLIPSTNSHSTPPSEGKKKHKKVYNLQTYIYTCTCA